MGTERRWAPFTKTWRAFLLEGVSVFSTFFLWVLSSWPGPSVLSLLCPGHLQAVLSDSLEPPPCSGCWWQDEFRLRPGAGSDSHEKSALM